MLALAYFTQGAQAARSVEVRIAWLQERAQHHRGFIKFIDNHNLLDKNGCENTLWNGTPIPDAKVSERTQRYCSKLRHTLKFEIAALGWTKRELSEAITEKHVRDWTVPVWPWLNLAHCEQGTGAVAVENIAWNAYSTSYEGAYGFLHSTWRENRLPWMALTANLATPREQTIVAMRLQRRYGWSPWPSCHIKLGLY